MNNDVTCTSLIDMYNARIAQGLLRPEFAQEEALDHLQNLARDISVYAQGCKGLLPRFIPSRRPQPPRGMYIHGSVGRGKSMIMDLFFEGVGIREKRREHFHRFMLEVHDALHHMRSEKFVGNSETDGVLPRMVRRFARNTRLLCLDEFHVGNIADAMILGRLLTLLFKAGVIVVSTSNWHPDELYYGGLQRDRFLPSIEVIKENMLVYRLGGTVDHRYEHIRNLGNFITPIGQDSTDKLLAIFSDLARGRMDAPIKIPVKGRVVEVPRSGGGVAVFSFNDLCGKPLGAADYLAIAECFHTMIISDVPVFAPEAANETLRFMTLIDALYENRVQLFMSSAAPPESLCPTGPHEFAFRRTSSRLAEMQTEEYRRTPHLG